MAANGSRMIFSTNPELADILGRMDLNLEIFYFSDFLDPTFPDIQVPNFQKCRAWAWARVGYGLWPGSPSAGPGGPSNSFGRADGLKRLETVSDSFRRVVADGC